MADVPSARPLPLTHLLQTTFRVAWLELAVAFVIWFGLARRVLEPRVGPLRAHQVAMAVRIVSVSAFAWLIVRLGGTNDPLDLAAAGGFWLAFVLVFEWGGSLLLRRPVREILEGWHVERGYMWPYVLAAYALAPLAAGLLDLP